MARKKGKPEDELLNLPTTGEVQNISFGDGLSLRVSPKGKKIWYLRYDTLSAEGKRKQNIVSLGDLATLTIEKAKAEAEKRKTLAKNENTNLVTVKKNEQLRKAQAAQTFETVAEAWLDLKAADWLPRSVKQNRGRLVANVYPVIGRLPINDITVPDVERALKGIIDRGSKEVARRVHTLIVSILKYALSKDQIKQPDIVARLAWYKEQMPKRKKSSHYEEELSPKEIGALMLAIHENRSRWTPPVSIALQLAPYCVLRPSELLGATWEEIDLDAAEWTVPAERMKMKRTHLVPLPRQAVTLLKKMWEFSGRNTFVFPSTSSTGKGKPVSTMALIQALRRMGYNSENDNRFVTHAFRGMFMSTAYNVLGAPVLPVDLQLAHSEKDKIKAAYHKTSLRTVIDERREILQRYADYLDELREEARNAQA